MAREKDGYREQLELILELYPGRVSLTVGEAAKILHCDARAVKAAIMRKVDPLPAQNIAKSGAMNKRYMIPVTALAKWSIG